MQDNEKLKALSEFDQAATLTAACFPSLWWKMYANCVQEGFSKEQALLLVIEFIRASYPRVS